MTVTQRREGRSQSSITLRRYYCATQKFRQDLLSSFVFNPFYDKTFRVSKWLECGIVSMRLSKEKAAD